MKAMNETVPQSEPKVSVLVPLYKTQEEHLRRMIESVLAQTLREFELILLNDSPEDTRLERIAAEYGDARIRYVCDGRNVGISAARNRLIELASAPYLAVLDHDDIMMPERLQLQVAYLDAHPEVGVVGCHVLEMPRNIVVRYPETDAQIRIALMDGCVVPHTGSVIRRSVLETTGIRYEAEYSPSEDYALWLRLLAHTKFHNIPQPLVKYRVHAANTSHAAADKMRYHSAELWALAQELYPQLYTRSLMLSKRITYIRLFSFIPLFRIVRRYNRATLYLFDYLPLFRIKTKKKDW